MKKNNPIVIIAFIWALGMVIFSLYIFVSIALEGGITLIEPIPLIIYTEIFLSLVSYIVLKIFAIIWLLRKAFHNKIH